MKTRIFRFLAACWYCGKDAGTYKDSYGNIRCNNCGKIQ